MNFVMYLHDYTLVWSPDDPGVVEQVQREINELVSDYTMGRCSVTLVAEHEELQRRIGELEDMLASNTDQWSDARDILSELIRNWNGESQVAPQVNALRLEFGLDEEGNVA